MLACRSLDDTRATRSDGLTHGSRPWDVGAGVGMERRRIERGMLILTWLWALGGTSREKKRRDARSRRRRGGRAQKAQCPNSNEDGYGVRAYFSERACRYVQHRAETQWRLWSVSIGLPCL